MAEDHGPRRAVALLVGIGEYQHAERVPSLRYAVRDATALREILIDSGVGAFPADRVELLADQDATRDRIVSRLANWLPAQANGAELALIYFAGHGLVHPVGDHPQGFLLAHDADPDDVITRGVSMADVAQWVGAVKASAVVVCLDCCHSGKALARSVPRDLELRPSVLERMAGHGRFLIASCDQGQRSFESDDLGHGLFTYHLLRGIEGAADQNGDGRVGVSELFHYVSREVARDARRLFHQEQTPWTSAFYRDEVWISHARPAVSTGKEAASPGADLERGLDANDEGALVRALRGLAGKPDPETVPALCRCLAHRSETVRSHAQQAFKAVGWTRAVASIERLARAGDEKVADVLEGLAAFESHPDVVALLDRLVEILRGDLRNRTVLLLERKRLALEFERMARLFEDIHSPYRLQRVLGQGLCTASYFAQAEGTDLEVVVRVLRPELASQPTARAGFLDLSKRSLHFVHQNLVLTREVRSFPEHQIHFAVRDHVDGVTLQKALDAGKSFAPQQVVQLARQVLDALTPVHQAGHVHGGIKPSNIFLCGGDRLILGDPALPPQGMGLTLERLTYDYRYVAPEALTTGPRPESDLYALGCVVYELLCGHPPFRAESYMELAALHLHGDLAPACQVNAALHPAWEGVLRLLLDRQGACRYPSLQAAAEGLEGLERALASPRALPAPPPLLRDASLNQMRSMVSVVPFGGETAPASPQATPVEGGQPPTAIPGYEILGELGRGGMGVVYRARQLALDRVVALKFLPASVTRSQEAGARFRREAMSLARLAHPNIVRIFDLNEHHGQLYFSMEFCEGGSLAAWLRRRSTIHPREAASLLLRLASGVQYAHESGILHRDLKPANILLSERGEPKIADFGLARLQEATLAERELLTLSGAMVGTPAYMAPEQVNADRQQVGPATDIYGLGTILYELLTGRRAAEGAGAHQLLAAVLFSDPTPPHQLNPGVDPVLSRICLRCLAKQPKDRYPSARDLIADLTRWLHGSPPVALEYPVARPAHQPLPLPYLLVMLFGLLCAGVAVVLGVRLLMP